MGASQTKPSPVGSNDTSALLKRRVETARETLKDESAGVRRYFEQLVDRNKAHQGDGYQPVGGDENTRVVLLQALNYEGTDELDPYERQALQSGVARATLHRGDAALNFAYRLLSEDGVGAAKDGDELQPNPYHVAALYLLSDQQVAREAWRTAAPRLSSARLYLEQVAEAAVYLSPLYAQNHRHYNSDAEKSAARATLIAEFNDAHLRADRGV